MPSVPMQEVVEVFLEEPTFEDERLSFMYHLFDDTCTSSNTEVEKINREYKLTPSKKNLIENIFTAFIKQNVEYATIDKVIIAARLCSLVALTESLAEKFKPKACLIHVTGPLKNIYFDIISPVNSFVGRTNELNALHQKLVNNFDVCVQARPVVVCGLQGIGKTQLCLKYVEQYGLDYYNNNCIWINAQSKHDIKRSFSLFAKRYLSEIKISNLPTVNTNVKNTNIKILVQKIYEFLAYRVFLIVFDGVKNFQDVAKYLPNEHLSPEKRFGVIVTSFSADFNLSSDQILELNEMSEEDARLFIAKKLVGFGFKKNDQLFTGLANLVSKYPLGLRQGCAFIQRKHEQNRDFDISDFLLLFRKTPYEFFKHSDDEINSLNEDYKFTLLTIFDSIMKQVLKTHDFGKLAFLVVHAEVDDNVKGLINKFIEHSEESRLKYSQALVHLKKYFVIRYVSGNDDIQFNSILIAVAKEKIKNDTEYIVNVRNICLSLYDLMPYIDRIFARWKIRRANNFSTSLLCKKNQLVDLINM